MYTPKRTKLHFKIIFDKNPVPISSAQQYHIYIIQIFIYFLKRKITENVLQDTPYCTINKKSGEYVPIPLNIFCSVIHYLLFIKYKKLTFLQIFFYKILAKYFPKRTKLNHF